MPATYYGFDKTFPSELRYTVTFEDYSQNKARLTIRHTGFPPPGRQEITVTRVFDAPREVVYKAYTDPKVIPNFWGPASLTTGRQDEGYRQGCPPIARSPRCGGQVGHGGRGGRVHGKVRRSPGASAEIAYLRLIRHYANVCLWKNASPTKPS